MPIPANATQIKQSTIMEEVYASLLSWIMDGQLRPGERISDTELAENLGVSRTPVREALRRLADKGLIETSASRWTRVAGISLDEAALVYPIITSLEELAVMSALPNLTGDDLDEMRSRNRELAQAIEQGKPMQASRSDAKFHGVFIAKSNNHHLAGILDDLKITLRRLEVFYFGGSALASDSVKEHQKIIEALEAKDAEAAREFVRTNWRHSLKRLGEAS